MRVERIGPTVNGAHHDLDAETPLLYVLGNDLLRETDERILVRDPDAERDQRRERRSTRRQRYDPRPCG